MTTADQPARSDETRAGIMAQFGSILSIASMTLDYDTLTADSLTLLRDLAGCSMRSRRGFDTATRRPPWTPPA